VGTGERLGQLIEEKGWSDAELARRLRVHRHWVTDRVNGRTAIKADEIPRLADALSVACSLFFAGSDCPEVQQRELSSTIRPLRDTRPLVDILEEQILQDLEASGFTSFEREALTEVADTLLRYRRRIQDEQASGE
jgi:transcriptional regulator with XRE-family HTH domain